MEEEELQVQALVYQSPTSWRRAPVEEPEVRQPGALRSRSLYVGYWHKQLEAHANTLRAEAVEALLV